MTTLQYVQYKAILFAIITGLLTMPATASTVFFDDTFNLSNYSIDTYQSGGASVNITQNLTGGNPGSALQVLSNIPSTPATFYTAEYFLNSSFLYDPATQGAIESIDYSADMYIEISPGSLYNHGSIAALYQDGNYYYSWIPSSTTTNGTWDTASSYGLQATDFSLVTDLLTLSIDSSVNPDFNGSIMQFGTITGTYTEGNTAFNWDIRVDNLSYTVNAVPVPAAVWLFGSGLIGLVGIARRKKIV